MTQRWRATVITAAVCASLICPPLFASAGDLYKWVDESGTLNFSDSIANVPQKYRDQVEKRELREERSRPAESASPARAEAGKPGNKEEEAPATTKYEIPYVNAYGGGRKGIVVQVTFNDRVTVPMLLDTGATGITISQEVAGQLGLLDKGETRLMQAIGGVGGTSMTVRKILRSVRMGEVREEFIPVNIMFNRLSPSFEGLFGMEFMGNYVFNINPARKVVELEDLPSRKSLPAGRDESWWRTNFQELNSYRDHWQEWVNFFDRKIVEDSMFPDKVEKYREYREISTAQYRAAEDLLNRLNRFAIDNYVPTHWRR
ncbi:MAG: aspartyl protease family protein [Nitrospirota bacterium]|nr:aspartyl protease family protein [Nitrospirota bacterium]